MGNYKISTTLFGELDIQSEDGLYEDYSIVLSGREMNIALNIFEDSLKEENLETVSGFLENISVMYKKGLNELLKIKDASDLLKYFIEMHLDELEDNMLEFFEVSYVSEITSEMFIQKLGIKSISISTNNDNEIDCTMDFSLPEDFTDELLVVRFNNEFEIYDISHES